MWEPVKVSALCGFPPGAALAHCGDVQRSNFEDTEGNLGPKFSMADYKTQFANKQYELFTEVFFLCAHCDSRRRSAEILLFNLLHIVFLTTAAQEIGDGAAVQAFPTHQ